MSATKDRVKRLENHLKRVLAGGDRTDFNHLGNFVGHELHKNCLADLDEFRSTLATIVPAGKIIKDYLPENGYLHGYADALATIIAAYSIPIERERDEQELMAYLRRNGLELLFVVLSERYQPAEFFPDDGSLGTMLRVGLVESIGSLPVYRLTLLGECILERLRKEKP